MQRIKNWIDAGEGFFRRRVNITSHSLADHSGVAWQVMINDYNVHAMVDVTADTLDGAWADAVAEFDAMLERRALERASSTERHPADGDRDGRAAE